MGKISKKAEEEMKEIKLMNLENNKENNEDKKTLFTFEKESCGCGGNCDGSCK